MHIDPWDPGNYPEPEIPAEQAWADMDRLLDQQKPDSGLRAWPLLLLLLPVWLAFKKHTGIFLLLGLLGGLGLWWLEARTVNADSKVKAEGLGGRMDTAEWKATDKWHFENLYQNTNTLNTGRWMKTRVGDKVKADIVLRGQDLNLTAFFPGKPGLQPSDLHAGKMDIDISGVAGNNRFSMGEAPLAGPRKGLQYAYPVVELTAALGRKDLGADAQSGREANHGYPAGQNTIQPGRAVGEQALAEIPGGLQRIAFLKDTPAFTIRQANGPAIGQGALSGLSGAKKKRNNLQGKGFSFGLAIKPTIPFRGAGRYFSSFDSGRQLLPLVSPSVWISRKAGKKGELMLDLNPFQVYHTGEQEIFSFKGPGPSPDTGSVNTVVSLQKAWGYGLTLSYRHSMGRRWGISGGIQYNKLNRALVSESVIRISSGQLLSNKLSGIRKDTSIWKEINPSFLQSRLELWYRSGRFETGAALMIPLSPHVDKKPRVMQGELIFRWRFRK